LQFLPMLMLAKLSATSPQHACIMHAWVTIVSVPDGNRVSSHLFTANHGPSASGWHTVASDGHITLDDSPL
jgi:hypothetical protein